MVLTNSFQKDNTIFINIIFKVEKGIKIIDRLYIV